MNFTLRGRKGQLAYVGVIISFMFYFMLWFAWLGGYLQQVGIDAIATNHYVGLTAFFFSYLGWFALIVPLILFIVIAGVGGSG